MPHLSVILITWNSEKYIDACLQSVLQATKDFSTEIIVIDNGSTDATKAILAPYVEKDNITLVKRKTNLGISKARNIGLKQAKGKFVWILDTDTVVNEEALSCMLSFMKENSDCGICACKLINSNGNIQDSCRKFPSLAFKIYNVLESFCETRTLLKSFGNKIKSLNQKQFYREEANGQKPFEVEYVIGACQLIKSTVIEEVGYLDEKIFYGPEDADFCMRVKNKRWKIVYIPTVSIIHEYQQITNKNILSGMGIIHAKALFYFWWKHKRF